LIGDNGDRRGTTLAEGLVETANLFKGKVREIKWFDVYFVDDDGKAIPNVDFEIIYSSGEKKTAQADGEGYFKDDKAEEGLIKIKMKDNSIIESYGNSKDFSEDDADPSNTSDSTIEYVIRPRDNLTKIAKRFGVQGGWHTLYSTVGPDGIANSKRLKSGNPNRIYPGESIWIPTKRRIVRINTKNAPKAVTKVRIRSKTRTTLQKKAAQAEDIYEERFNRQAIDNLLIVAGWDDSRNNLNVKKLCDALKPIVKFVHPKMSSAWNLYVIQGNIMNYCDDTGNLQHKFVLNAVPKGAAGAYTMFQLNGNIVTAGIYNRSCGLADPTKQYEAAIEDLLDDEKEKNLYSSSIMDLDSTGTPIDLKKVPVFYLAPTTKALWWTIISEGGNGMLDDYIGDSDYNDKAHARNCDVLDTYASVFRGLLNAYINKVAAVDLSKGEDGIRELNRPPEPYRFPLPARVTHSQKLDLIKRMQACTSYLAWLEISKKIYDIDNYNWPSSSSQHREGALFFRPKLTLEPDVVSYIMSKLDKLAEILPIFGRSVSYKTIKLEWNFDIGSDGFKPGSSQSVVFKEDSKLMIPSKKFDLGYGREVEIDDSGGKKINFKLSAGSYGLETATDGEFKLTGPSGATAYSNPKTAEMGFGVTIPIPFLGQVYVGIGMVGLKAETVMVYLSGAPGFFERKSPDTLVKTAWTNLEYWETQKLQILGWTQENWDIKDQLEYGQFPKSVKTDLDSLSPAEYIAGLHLGFQRRKAATWVDFWKKSLPPVEGIIAFKPMEIRAKLKK
jgi:hypothetical protein